MPRVAPAAAGAFLLLVASAATAAAAPKGDARRGGQLYEAKCGACHSLDANRVGPRHRGVVGRRAGSVSGFAYSAALRKSGIVWTPEALDRWLAAPTAMVKGTSMGFRVPSAAERADIIAYLQSVSPRPRKPAR